MISDPTNRVFTPYGCDTPVNIQKGFLEADKVGAHIIGELSATRRFHPGEPSSDPAPRSVRVAGDSLTKDNHDL